jgi:hypothetical protein
MERLHCKSLRPLTVATKALQAIKIIATEDRRVMKRIVLKEAS